METVFKKHVFPEQPISPFSPVMAYYLILLIFKLSVWSFCTRVQILELYLVMHLNVYDSL